MTLLFNLLPGNAMTMLPISFFHSLKKRAMFYLVKNTSSTPWYVTMSMSNIYGARERGGACL